MLFRSLELGNIQSISQKLDHQLKINMKRGKQEKSGIKVERRRKKVESGNLILIKGQIIVEKVKTDKDIEIVNL